MCVVLGAEQVQHFPYRISSVLQQVLPFQKNSEKPDLFYNQNELENLDQSYKMDIDFQDCFER